jgi:hypothetical protein
MDKSASFTATSGLLPTAIRKLIAAVIVCVCLLLLALNIYGAAYPPDFRNQFSQPPTSYSRAISLIREARQTYGNTPRFFTEAIRIYRSAVAYDWPSGMARVSFSDNWMLALAAHLDPTIHRLGLKKDSLLFSQFESFRYERAFGRGFGICSQNALGFADLMYREFNADVRVLALGGHVVTQLKLPNGQMMILDPSIGVVLTFSISYAESHLPEVERAYKEVGYAELASVFDHAGNFLADGPGGRPYAYGQYWKQSIVMYFEQATDILIWIVPLTALLIIATRHIRKRRQSEHQ